MSSELRPAKPPLDEYEMEALRAWGSLRSQLAHTLKLIHLIEESPASPEDSERLPDLHDTLKERLREYRQYQDYVGGGTPEDRASLRQRLVANLAIIRSLPADETIVHQIYDATELIPSTIASTVSKEIDDIMGAIEAYFDSLESELADQPEGDQLPMITLDPPAPAVIISATPAVASQLPLKPRPSSPGPTPADIAALVRPRQTPSRPQSPPFEWPEEIQKEKLVHVSKRIRRRGQDSERIGSQRALDDKLKAAKIGSPGPRRSSSINHRTARKGGAR